MSTKTIARMGLMFSLTLALTVMEQAIPPVPWFPPGVKLGLSHMVIMYGVFHMGKTEALCLGVLKSLFVLLTRGLLAAALSFVGGMLSLAVVIALAVIYSKRIPYRSVAVLGAVTHNMGQLALYSLMVQVNLLFFYLPLLLVSGVLAGVVTGTLLKLTAPVFTRFF